MGCALARWIAGRLRAAAYAACKLAAHVASKVRQDKAGGASLRAKGRVGFMLKLRPGPSEGPALGTSVKCPRAAGGGLRVRRWRAVSQTLGTSGNGSARFTLEVEVALARVGACGTPSIPVRPPYTGMVTVPTVSCSVSNGMPT